MQPDSAGCLLRRRFLCHVGLPWNRGVVAPTGASAIPKRLDPKPLSQNGYLAIGPLRPPISSRETYREHTCRCGRTPRWPGVLEQKSLAVFSSSADNTQKSARPVKKQHFPYPYTPRAPYCTTANLPTQVIKGSDPHSLAAGRFQATQQLLCFLGLRVSTV